MSLSFDDHKLSLARFAERVPDLLVRYGATATLAEEFRALELGAELTRRNFSLAIVGRMKAGKSTLINALVGANIAPVGMNETTATVNWIERGDCNATFDIHWRDETKATETRPISRLDELIGRSEQAAAIDHLRFECPAEFLDGVRLIDAPGTMSTIETHEAQTADLVTRRYGERADAVILALPTVVARRDADLIETFAEQTRLPGQGAYNTIAVMQKWEALDAHAPEEAAAALAANFRERLQQHVADVLPVSGLLAIFAREVSDEDLDAIAYLARNSTSEALTGLMKMETRFVVERDGIALSAKARSSLMASLKVSLLGPNLHRAAGTFEALRFAIGLARRRDLRGGGALRKALREVSGIDQLHELLERRFFAAAGLIKSGSILRKAIEPCRTAAITLRQAQSQREGLITGGKALLTRGVEGADLHDHLAATLAILKGEREPIDNTARELDALTATAERDFRMLMDDIAHLHALADDTSLPFTLRQPARRLFGQFGCERQARLGLGPLATIVEQHEAAHRMLQDFFLASQTNRIARHADARLSFILDQLDAELAE